MVEGQGGTIFTIGHGGWSVEGLLSRLEELGVQFLVDVRSVPVSRYPREFSREPLRDLLARRGIRYVYMGDQLGGRPADPDCYAPGGRVLYSVCREKPFFREGIRRLLEGIGKGYRLCLFCSEGRPWECHRSRLIGEVLAREGIDVRHVLRGGGAISQEECRLRETEGQLTLFEGEERKDTSRGRYR